MIGDSSFDDSVLKYYLLNYYSSHCVNPEQLNASGLNLNNKDRDLFNILLDFSKTSNHSIQEASHVAGFIIAANMFSNPGPFLPPETENPKYTSHLPDNGNLLRDIAQERTNKNEGAIITGGYLGDNICNLFFSETDYKDPLIIFGNPLYTVVRLMNPQGSIDLITSEVLKIFLPPIPKNQTTQRVHNARLISSLGAALLYNPDNNDSNYVYMLKESPFGEEGWGILTKMKVKYEPNQIDISPVFPIEYNYTNYVLLTEMELEEREIKFAQDLCLPNTSGVYLVRREYTLDTKQLPNTRLKLKGSTVLDARTIFQE